MAPLPERPVVVLSDLIGRIGQLRQAPEEPARAGVEPADLLAQGGDAPLELRCLLLQCGQLLLLPLPRDASQPCHGSPGVAQPLARDHERGDRPGPLGPRPGELATEVVELAHGSIRDACTATRTGTR